VKRLPAACLLFLLLLSVLLPPCDASSAGHSPRKILLLTSYHQGDRWNDSVVKGVREALGTLESVSLSIENLDMRRYPNQDHTRVTAEYIRAKYQGRPQDLILVSDDPALDFLLTVREDLFPNTPVVFCGVNNFTPKRIQGQHNITGINEALSLEATLELALKLFPKTARITAVVSDTEASGRANLQEYRAAAARMKGRVQFDELLNMIDKDAPEILSRLPKDSLVLRLINLLKPEGGYLSIQKSIRILSAHAPVPVFTLWSFDLGDGALGGYVSSGQDQGRAAGNLAIRILEGQEAEQIPVIMNSPNVPMFDYKVMERFGLKESALPKGSVILNHLLSIWEQYWAWFLGIALFCVLQTFLILNLLTRGTRLHAANAALGESEHFTRSLLETIPVPVFYKGRDGRYQGFNKAFLNFYGRSKEELIGKSVFDITSPDMAKVYHAHDMELFENPGTQIYPYQVKTSEGDLREVIFHKASLTDEHGSVTGLIGAILDVTDQKHTEIALLESERRFKNLHNASFGGIAIHDQGNILDCNQGLSHITGYPYEELIGMNGLRLIALQSRELVMAYIAAGHEKPYEAWGLRKNGEVYPLRLEARNIPFQGREMRVVEFRDITERKRAEEEREKLQAQLTQAQKMESVGRLAGGVAHDFNNMLGVILGHTEMALDDVDPAAPLHASLQAIHQAAERSAALTRQLLAFARKQTVAPKVININETVAGMLNMLRRLIGEDIDLLWQPGKDLPPVKVDPAQIDQLLANLCVNARDAIAGQGKITIETGVKTFDEVYCADHFGFLPGEYLVLEVNDDGCGMDKKILSHIFEPFFTTKEQGKGTGLGLASVFGMVQQNKGFIDVDSEPGKGTAFKIYLPVYAEKSAGVVEKAPDLSAEQGNETILLVEDEPAILQMTTMMLTRLGYTVVVAATPGEAIRLALEYRGKIDLLMTDVVMPEMNGRTLTGNLLSHYPDLKRLFMSGYTADIIAHHGVLDEGVHFIQKPFSMKDLGRTLRETLDGRHGNCATDFAKS